MRMNQKKAALWLLTACLILILAGCGAKERTEAPSPLSSLTWNSSYEEMVAVEGKALESYDSVYGGPAYTYAKEYQGQKGTLKYMFDGNQQLMCIAWAFETADRAQLDQLYTALHGEVVERHGESGYNPGNSTNYGDVWYLDSGHIILSAVTGQDQYALQYAYLNPLASDEE